MEQSPQRTRARGEGPPLAARRGSDASLSLRGGRSPIRPARPSHHAPRSACPQDLWGPHAAPVPLQGRRRQLAPCLPTLPPPLPLPFFHDTNGARETATCATDRGEAGRADTASTHPRRPPSEAAASPADCRARHAHKCATVSKPGGGGGKGRCARPRRRGGLRARVPARDVARGPWAPEASIG